MDLTRYALIWGRGRDSGKIVQVRGQGDSIAFTVAETDEKIKPDHVLYISADPLPVVYASLESTFSSEKTAATIQRETVTGWRIGNAVILAYPARLRGKRVPIRELMGINPIRPRRAPYNSNLRAMVKCHTSKIGKQTARPGQLSDKDVKELSEQEAANLSGRAGEDVADLAKGKGVA